jgi:2-dehydropantoate 2-reductase
MKIAVMGAGGVGCFHGALLARAGHEVCLIGRPSLVEAVRRDGLRFDSKKGFSGNIPMSASASFEAAADAELVLVCVKSGDTETAGAAMAPHLSADVVVMSLQNGVDNAERLAATCGRAVIPAAVYVAVGMEGPGHVRHHGRGELMIGDTSNSERIAALMTEAGIPTEVSPDVRVALWEKLAINCAFNALSAIPQIQYGELMAFPGVADVMTDVIAECRAVAKAAGIVLSTDLDAAARRIAQTMASQRSSTAQDLAAGKRSEIDHLNGYVTRRGEALGVAVPVNRALWVMVRLLERGVRGG